MKKNILYLITLVALIISLILSILTRNYKIEELSLIDLILFSGTAILISASLMWFTKKVVKKTFYKMPLALLFALLSCFIYFKMFISTFRQIGSGESGMIFGGIFGVLGSIVVGLMSIFVNFFILSKKRVEKRTI